MKLQKLFLLVVALFLLAGALCPSADASVTGVAVRSTGHSNIDERTVRFNFEGRITSNSAGIVTYRWIRSDGASAPIKSILFSSPGSRTVTSSWDLGRGDHAVHRWKAIEILTPNRMTSGHADFTVPPLGGSVTRVTVRSTGRTDIDPSHIRFDFEGRISVDSPMTVTYRWIRSDGASTPVETLVFSTPGARTVTTSWQLPRQDHPVHLWQALEVVTPNPMTSNHTNFTVPPLSGAVSSVTARSTGHTDVDANTVRFDFEGRITASVPTTVTYRWIRSDGASPPTETLTFSSAGTRTVTSTWQLGRRDHPVTHWKAIEILTPNSMTSNHAEFTVPPLGGSVTHIAARVAGRTEVDPDHLRFDFEGRITVDSPMTVTYRWIRSDGASPPTETLTFSSAGSRTVTSSWQLGKRDHPVTLWKAVEVLTPNAMTSNHAEFTVPARGGSVTNVEARVAGLTEVGPNQIRFSFEGRITADSAMTVTYRWIRSDGASAPVETLVFSSAGSRIVSTSWQLGRGSHPVHLWQAVEVLTPNSITSGHANFTVPPLP